MNADVDRVAQILDVSNAESREFLQRCGAWEGVPIQLRFNLPFEATSSRGRKEWEEFRSEVPEAVWNVRGPDTPLNRAIYGFSRGIRDSSHPVFDHPNAQPKNAHGRFPCGGYHSYQSGQPSPKPLGHAQLPAPLSRPLARRLLEEGKWKEFTDLPLYQIWNIYDRISGRGHFPTMLVDQLRDCTLFRPYWPPESSDEEQMSSPLSPARDLYRVAVYPRTESARANVAARFLRLFAEEEVRGDHALPLDCLDILHVVSLDECADIRLLIRALFLLQVRSPCTPMPDNGDAMVLWRAFRAAHREIWEAIESSLDLPKNPRDKQLQTKLARARESLNSACRDAATLGWIPEEVRDFSKLQLLTCQPPYWRLVGACQQLDPYQAAFYDQEIGRGYRGQFEGKIAFVELPPNAVVLAHLLDIPIFRPRDPQYLLEEGPSEICGYLSELTERLLPFIREIVTRQPASGGLPMPEQVFEDRIARAGLQHPRFRLVASWPLTIPLEKPVGAVVAVPEGHSECFRYIESLEGYPTFLVHHRQVTDLEDAKKHRWCLDTPLAHALDSNGHAPFIQNLLR